MARPEGSVDRLAGKVRDTEGRRRGETTAPYGASSRSNRLEGTLVKGFPMTTSYAGIRVSECERIVRGWCGGGVWTDVFCRIPHTKRLNVLRKPWAGANF